MIPYKFISTEKFLEDIRSGNPEFDILLEAYQKSHIKIVGGHLYLSYTYENIIFCKVDSTDYIILQDNGILTVLEEDEVES